ncbi:hypothetical protein L0U85_03685 [Glycomyces sp. L485]|uniref:hypothetical protein n=1 Tax=Glycomyces sp. L485 TaxID=2909235 RepID=UPI001F4A146D|nr:hypothetical protein [Glycomyces sp. L485]MCH7229963.1 hypothetical protein [Glycomyces sp. L485]
MHAKLTWRSAAIALAPSLSLMVLGQPAQADIKPPSCSDGADSCEVVVEIPGQDGGSSDDTGSDSGGGTDSTGSSGGEAVDPDGCEYITVDPDLAPPGIGERPSEDHVLVARACRGEDAGSVTDFQWVEADENGNLAIDPEILAAQAVDNLQLPRPAIEASPAEAQLVHLATWLWIEEASWQTQTATASVPGLTVTVTAAPVKATWDMGDGNTVTCRGPGTAWEGIDPEASSPDCGHTYMRPSDEPLRTSVTVYWEVTWSGGGESGSVPGMTTTDSVTWQVVESHSLVTR